MRGSRIFVLALLSLVARPAAASDAEILALRERVRIAAAAKDRATLEASFADTFSHLRDGGRTDLKGERIALLLAGTPGIETVPEDELAIMLHGDATATATGATRIRDPETSRLVPFRWLAVFARIEGRWRIVLSEAHRAR